MSIKAIKNGRIITPEGIAEDKILLFEDKILDLVETTEGIEVAEFIDAQGRYVSPGFIDIHTHGAFGYDTMDEDVEAIKHISKGIVRNGVTGFLPTTISMAMIKTYKALEHVGLHMKGVCKGAKVLGAHLEGPFINPLKKGAHDENFIIKPDIELIRNYKDIIKVITIAPEMDEDFSFIKQVSKEKKTVMSMGHTNATYEEAKAAIKAGVRSTTHLFNAMSSLNHREPGVVLASLESDIYAELIADKIHVHPDIFHMLLKMKGIDRIILITDSMSAACMKCGEYSLGGQQVRVDETSARLADGTLAGSILRLNVAVRNFKEATGLSIAEAVKLVTINPATLIGEGERRGSIEKGKYADLVIFDEDIEIAATIVEGSVCFKIDF